MSTTYTDDAVRHRTFGGEGKKTFARIVPGLAHALTWPLRVLEARRELEMLAGMSEHELKDIGLTRSDLSDATALPAAASPTDFLAERVAEGRHSLA